MRNKQHLASSRAREIYRDIVRGRTTLEASKKQMEVKDWAVLQELRELLARDNRPDLLVKIANLHDEGCHQHSLTGWLEQFDALTEQKLLQLRDELRHVWCGGGRSSQYLFSWLTLSVPSEEDNDARIKELQEFFGRPFGLTKEYAPISPHLELGRFIVDSRNLPAQLVQAVLEHRERMRICANPECAVPYFLAQRSTQKYCEAGVCVNYAARQYKRGYWHRVRGAETTLAKRNKKVTKKGAKSGKTKTNRK